MGAIKYKNFKIVVSENSYDLYEIKISRRVGQGSISKPLGEEYEKEVEAGFFSTLGSVLYTIINKEIRNRVNSSKKDLTLEDLRNLVFEITEEIKTTCGVFDVKPNQ